MQSNLLWTVAKPPYVLQLAGTETGPPRLERIIQTGKEQAEPHFSRAKLIPEELQAAQVLSSKVEREMLIELSQAGFVREQDVLGSKAKDEIRTALENLLKAGLLNVEHLLECKRTGTRLTRLRDLQQLQDTNVGTLICPSCGSNFSQELPSKGYSLSDLGRKMSRQSYWMTVWVTDMLTKLGVPQDAILWNVSESGEEVDLLMDQLWIFELKDREFGSGDAYPLNYRQVRYRVNKAIIVTTERVSRDAKRVLSRPAEKFLKTPVEKFRFWPMKSPHPQML
ncbi:MAG: hypothetical protein K6U74_05595 [Firmicutes bacterium]|nr:hypothetical protein [Bacillota bacterium]